MQKISRVLCAYHIFWSVKMKSIQAFIYTIVAYSLAACGSGGGNSPDMNSHQNPNYVGSNAGSSSNTGDNAGSNNNAKLGNIVFNPNPYFAYGNKDITTAVGSDKTLYSITHSWKVTPPTEKLAAEVQTVVNETNKLRAEVGLPALKYDEHLSAFAQRRAEELVRSYEHYRLNGDTVWTGTTPGLRGENIYASPTTAIAAVTGWKKSSGHYANMIEKNYTKIGVGVVYVPNSKWKYYWVQYFGSDNVTSKYYFDTNIAETDNKTPLSTLLVDGISIPLTTPNGNWKTLDNSTYKGTYNGYSYTRFGVLTNAKANTGLYQTFYQGVPTSYNNMPQTGTAQYIGQAVWVNKGNINNQLSAQFNVDFAKKTLSGSIRDTSNQAVNLNANITGNTFHSAIDADVETHGGFFGTQAEEISGDFREQKKEGKIGAFGAIKQ